MKIAPIMTTNTNSHYNKPVSFKRLYGDDSREQEEKEVYLALPLTVIPFGIAMFIATAIATDPNNHSEKKDTFLDKTEQLVNSNTVRTDTFTVKDVNDDESPDLILYKKDGSKIVIDCANQKILEETKQ